MNRDAVKRGFDRSMKGGAPALLFSLTLSLTACNQKAAVTERGAEPVEAPAHPAMRSSAPVATEGERPAHPPGLPEGHPPIGGMSREAPETDAKPPSRSGASREVVVAGIRLVAPEGWIPERPSSSFRLAQFRLPAAEEAGGDGVLTVSPPIGGSVDDNIRRWEGQFEGAPKARRENRTVGGIQVHIAVIEGTYIDKPPFAPSGGTPRPNYLMWGAVIQAPAGQVFLKAWGPKATMEKWRPSLEEFVSSIQPAG